MAPTIRIPTVACRLPKNVSSRPYLISFPKPGVLGAAESASQFGAQWTLQPVRSQPVGLGTLQGDNSEGSGDATGVSVEDCLARATQAADEAEAAVEKVDSLPSAWPDPLIVQYFKKIDANMVLIALFLVSHYFGGPIQWLGGALGAIVISLSAFRKGSLSESGGYAAWLVGFGSLGSSLRCGVTLLAFFFSSTKLTRWKAHVKSRVDAEYKKGGQRDWRQVFSNGFVPTLVAVAYGLGAGFKDLPLDAGRSKLGTFLMAAYLGYYSCCCGDTWASEVGVLSQSTPRLVTTGRPVRRGTNGGVTLLGLGASTAGGLFMGLVFYCVGFLSPGIRGTPQAISSQAWVIGLGLLGGLLGSLVDSFLGATVQYSGFDLELQKVVNKPGDPDRVLRIAGCNILNNNQVNLVSASLTSLLIGSLALRVF